MESCGMTWRRELKMKRAIIAAAIVMTITPVAAQTFDFTNPEAQCTVEVLTEETASTVANSPMGKQGYQVLYVKDPKELFRSKDKLSCQAIV
jgi:hypothetical protein